MSLEDLAGIEISLVSRRAESQHGAAAAVYVITAEDIARSTAQTIPDLLRMVPGFHVAHLNGSKWSVSSRGFGGRFASSLLVMIDGRSIYAPLFSGVYWETRHVMLEDVERIEVVRGPGGSLWGANAVNGIINIVTKNAADTKGGLAGIGAGSELKRSLALRYGGKVGSHGSYRVYGKSMAYDEAVYPDGRTARDGWSHGQLGTRLDWNWDDSQLMLQAKAYATDTAETNTYPFFTPPYNLISKNDEYFHGGSVLGRWNRTLEHGGDLSIQAYYDRSGSTFIDAAETRDTLDIEFQHRLSPRGRHEVTWGGGFRWFKDRMDGSAVAALSPETTTKQLFSAFIQDRISLIEDRLILTLGTKLEHNDFTGFEIQPTARLAWMPTDRQTLWTSVSRAVRTPSVVEERGQLAGFGIPGALFILGGNPGFDSEETMSFEAGYRVRPTDNLNLDFAAFYNHHKSMRSIELGTPEIALFPAPHVNVLSLAQNNLHGNSYGLEFSGTWSPTRWWTLRLNYTLLKMDLALRGGSLDFFSGTVEDSSPEQQVWLGSHFAITEELSADVNFRYVDGIPALGVDNYFTMDLRLSWRPSKALEFTLVGHDLLDAAHLERTPDFLSTFPTEVERGVYGKVTWRF